MRTVVVSGGSRGIGEAIVQKFKAAGDLVVACSRSVDPKSKADFFMECDVSDRAQVLKFSKTVIERFGNIDILVNNAGIAGSNSLEPEDSDDLWDQIIGTNLFGTYYLSKAFYRSINDQTGSVINIASVLGLIGVPDQTAYCAAKHGVVGFTKSLAQKLGSRGITVNAVCPGWTRTQMAVGRLQELGMSDEYALRNTPTGRWVEPAEVAEFVFFLASKGARSITGKALTIDGGAVSA